MLADCLRVAANNRARQRIVGQGLLHVGDCAAHQTVHGLVRTGVRNADVVQQVPGNRRQHDGKVARDYRGSMIRGLATRWNLESACAQMAGDPARGVLGCVFAIDPDPCFAQQFGGHFGIAKRNERMESATRISGARQPL